VHRKQAAQADVKQSKVSRLAEALAGLVMPELPSALNPSSELAGAIEKLDKLHTKTAYSLESVRLPVLPELHPVGDLLEKGKALARLERAISLRAGLDFKCVLPELLNTADLHEKLLRTTELEKTEAKLKLQIEAEAAALLAAHVELENTVQALGGVCPVCHHSMSSEDVLHDLAA
jgi:hypothetical protein